MAKLHARLQGDFEYEPAPTADTASAVVTRGFLGGGARLYINTGRGGVGDGRRHWAPPHYDGRRAAHWALSRFLQLTQNLPARSIAG